MSSYVFADVDGGYLAQAAEQILEGLKLLQGVNGKPVVRHTQMFQSPSPTAYPAALPIFGGIRVTSQDAGEPYNSDTYTIVLRYIVGKASEKLHGEQERELWVNLVRIHNWINRHPDLRFAQTQPDIDELMPYGAKSMGGTRLGIFRDDPEHLGVDYGIEVPFHVSVDEIDFYDDEEV
jgi:hypothetical protein